MGTRGIYGFHRGGEDKLTYNHFDSYPSNLGKNVVSFIASNNIGDLNDIFNKIIMVEEDSTPTDEQIAECKDFYDNRLNAKGDDKISWYHLLRNAQGELEPYKGSLKYMTDNSEFIKDSLFCEWGYIINLDTNVLEIYKGFQTKQNNPLNRYSIEKKEPMGSNVGEEFYSCKLIKEIPITDLTIKSYEEMIDELENLE